LATTIAVAAPLAAQAPVLHSTGSNVVGGIDQSWTVSWTRLLNPSGHAEETGSGNARVVGNPPAPWVDNDSYSRWISAQGDA
ncbi:hypothetical protein NL466_29700, partial [Klebsiella pneumoniae]|nr:hypothetical protein [Klebsiella pneumoniae]